MVCLHITNPQRIARIAAGYKSQITITSFHWIFRRGVYQLNLSAMFILSLAAQAHWGKVNVTVNLDYLPPPVCIENENTLYNTRIALIQITMIGKLKWRRQRNESQGVWRFVESADSSTLKCTQTINQTRARQVWGTVHFKVVISPWPPH